MHRVIIPRAGRHIRERQRAGGFRAARRRPEQLHDLRAGSKRLRRDGDGRHAVHQSRRDAVVQPGVRPGVRVRHVRKAPPRTQPVVKALREHRKPVAVLIVAAGRAEILGIVAERPAHARGRSARLRELHAGRRRRDMGRSKRCAAAHRHAAGERRDRDTRARRAQIDRRAGGRIGIVKRPAAVHGRDREHLRLIGGIDIVRVRGGVAPAEVARRRDDDDARGIRLREDTI